MFTLVKTQTVANMKSFSFLPKLYNKANPLLVFTDNNTQIKMACQKINLNYCAECHQIDKANISNCAFLQFNFCTLTCLKCFNAKIVVDCDLCKQKFNHNNRIHVRDDVSKDAGNSYIFICDQCFERRSTLATRCHYCTNVCYKGFGAQLMTATGLIMKYRCSIDCQAKVVNRKELTVCSECSSLSKCDEINCNGQMYAVCSVMCFENYTEREKISVGSFFFYFGFSNLMCDFDFNFCIFLSKQSKAIVISAA